MQTTSPPDIKTPEQILTSLSFCEAGVKPMEHWVSSLPMANVGESAKRLYQGLVELNQFICPPQARFQILEVLRPSVYYVCRELSKHFLNQPIALPEKPLKIAKLAQALQLHLANGYKIVVSDIIASAQEDKHAKVLKHSCHRAINDLGHTVLRSYQLYTSPPPGAWLELHQLFAFAEQHGWLGVTLVDDENTESASSLLNCYKRIMLLGCCKPNQMRQSDLAAAYDAFQYWGHWVQLGQHITQSALFVVNVHQDAAPLYKSLAGDSKATSLHGVDTSELVHRLTDYLEAWRGSKQGKRPDGDLYMPLALSEAVLEQLAKALGIMTKRSFKRIASEGTLEICIGLSATHYYCSDQIDFAVQLTRADTSLDNTGNIFMSRGRAAADRDVWSGQVSGASDHLDSGIPINFPSQHVEPDQVAYPSHEVPVVNTSPGGYCLQWQSDAPKNILAGELIGLREREDQPWSIGVIRWIRKVQQQGTQIGVELIAPQADPCGVQMLQRTGDASEFLRGLLLPELKAISQPQTLIAPRLPFQSGQKVYLNQLGIEQKCLLDKKLSATGSFSQFLFTPLGDLKADKQAAAKASEDDFDSLWPDL